MSTQLDEKEKQLQEQFNSEQREAVILEEQIKALQLKHAERIANMTRIQGAFSLIKDLRDGETKQ